jgi:hypothetical protein
MKACPHAHGEYRDDYRHCTDCGAEWMLIGGEWHVIEAWVRVHKSFLGAPRELKKPRSDAT